MAKIAFDTKAWLKDLGIKDDKIDELLPHFEPIKDRIGEMQMRQSDYDRKMNEMKSEYEERNEKLNADIAEFASLSAAEQAERTDLRDRIDAAEAKSLQLSQKITRYAESNGVDPKTILGDVEPAKVPDKTTASAYDDSKLRGDINTTIGGLASYMLDLNASIDDIAREHQELTGERFDRKKFVAGIKADIVAKKTDNLDPVKRWEKEFGIAERRTAAAQKNRETEIAKAREEGRLAAMSEMALPGGHAPSAEHNSPVFKTTNVAKGSVLQRPQPSQRLNGAISALTTGKYRGGRTAA